MRGLQEVKAAAKKELRAIKKARKAKKRDASQTASRTYDAAMSAAKQNSREEVAAEDAANKQREDGVSARRLLHAASPAEKAALRIVQKMSRD